jgi:putative membrane protein
MPIVNRLSDPERARVTAAVEAAEARSAAEIVTVLTEQSDGYSDVALVWSAIVGLAALIALTLLPDFYLGIYDRITDGWEQQWHPRAVFAVATAVVTIKFVAMWLLQLWKPLRFLLIPGRIKHDRVRARALTCFRMGAEQRTVGRTGILIYLSMREHRAEIVAEEAIASKVSAEVWGEAMALMLPHLKDGRLAEGMAAAVARVGDVLAEHFPRSIDDINEIPDRLIEV